jgi:hypothetical protein
MGFTPNPRFTTEVRGAERMAAFLGEVAQEAAAEVDRSSSKLVRSVQKGRNPYRVWGEVVQGRDGPEGRVNVQSSYWGWDEFGTSLRAARPFIRPAVLRVLARRGGRIGDT